MIPLLDTHQHLIYRNKVGYDWTGGIPALAQGDFTLTDYAVLTRDSGISGSLFMETGVNDADYQAEGRFTAELAEDKASGLRGIIASIRPEEDEGFDAWLEESVALGVVGYRRILHVVDDELSTTATFRRNVSKIGKTARTFDMCYLSRQLPLAAELAKACPDTTFILDHCGVPDIAGNGLDPWRANMTALASLPNVNCKLSGILAYCAPGTASLETIRPYLDHVLECFTPQRIVWGSDWPVVNLANGLPDWINVTRSILDELSEDEAHAIGHQNAERIYGLA
ncbi:amidohydrolase family protein [Roseibium sediminis]|uniref:amidohydrolase family protein n=1 Tax=Roseibium sediminis TaxID=1775174 RepID=UPI00195A5555|nr:amidohydrolase [Roseibium sediminis]